MTAIEKVLWLIDNRDVVQADVARAAMIDPARISEWRRRLIEDKKATLTTEQGYGIARFFGVSLDWLADDDQGVPPIESTMSDDMRIIMTIVGDLGPKVARQRLVKSPALEVETVPETDEQRRYAEDLTRGKSRKDGRKMG